jgi:hypothetical protein
MLLRDIVFIFQGINGQFIKYNEDSLSYIIDPKVCANNYERLFIREYIIIVIDKFIFSIIS